ncbi:MAG: hypothetical protein ABW092_07470 [Candidatus Thiodiazotropha sp.]
MKYVVSISLGSGLRDQTSELELLGQRIILQREGWGGDFAKITKRFEELDGQVDALGMGGADLWVYSKNKRFRMHAAHKLIRHVTHTPIVDGSGLKNTLEKQTAEVIEKAVGKRKRVLITCALERPGMTQSFFEHGYEVLCGDLGFSLGIPYPIYTQKALNSLASFLMPVVSRLPQSMLYPIGETQNQIKPKFQDWYNWAEVIAGDCLYIRRHIPKDLSGKIIVTNTTTSADRKLFTDRGVERLFTTTPIIEGRSYGANVLEAALTALKGLNRPLNAYELQSLINQLSLKPTLAML